MNRDRHVRSLAIVFLATFAWHGIAYGQGKRIDTMHFVIEYNDITEETAKVVARDAEQAFYDVTSFFGKDFSDRKIQIRIGKRYRFPRSLARDVAMEIPANRLGPGGAPTGPRSIRGRGPTFWHGVANVVAQSGHEIDGWGRFLQEGIGGYLQAKFGGKMATPWPDKVYPSMGEDVHHATARRAAEDGLLKLEKARQEVNQRKLTRTRRLAWLQAASFVGYLVENMPRGKFKRWYDGSSFKEAYGIELRNVEREWAKFILGLGS